MATARVYVGKLPADVQKADLEGLFKGYGLVDVKLLGTFGFCEFEDPRDAEDVVQKFNGEDLLGEKISVEHAKGLRQPREPAGPPGAWGPYGAPPGYGRLPPRIKRGAHRVIISNLPPRTSWQDLKDIGRECGQISFADVDPIRPDEGILEYQSREDMQKALDKIEGMDLRGNKLRADPAPAREPSPPRGGGRYGGGYGGGPPGGGGGYGGGYSGYDDYGYPPYGAPPPPPGRYGGGYGGRGGYDDRRPPPPPRGGGGYEDRRGPPRGYEDRRGPPPPRDQDEDRYSAPPRRGAAPVDDDDREPPPRRREADRSRSPAPRRGADRDDRD